jgi:polar amino acid transport system substrate-binding protein
MTARGRIGLFVLFTLASLTPLAALAQQEPPPFVVDENQMGRFSDDYTLRYCVDPRDPAWQADQAIAEAIAGALLIEPAPYLVPDKEVREPIDNLYRHLRADCAIYFGFKLLSGVYPEWLTVSRPYYEVGYVLAVKNEAWQKLGDIPRTEALGPTMGTAADFQLIQYLNGLPQSERWKRFPIMSDEVALDEVLSGEVAAALVWGPSFAALKNGNPKYAGLRTISLDPLPDNGVPVGAVLLSSETFLRSSVDQAIDSLIKDGTIERIIAEHGLSATPAR